MPVWLIPKLLFAWGGLKRGASAFGGFLRRHSAWLTVSLVLLACWGVDHVICHRHAAHVEKQLASASNALNKERKGRVADRAAYTKAQADAVANNKAHVANIEAQQKEITDDVEARYRADLARLRMSNAAPQSAPSDPEISAPGKAPCGPDGKALSLPGPELLQARETELQLNALIDWVNQQTEVDPNEGTRSK
jgi:hypothetical protein